VNVEKKRPVRLGKVLGEAREEVLGAAPGEGNLNGFELNRGKRKFGLGGGGKDEVKIKIVV
jgi:hypothetical protein